MIFRGFLFGLLLCHYNICQGQVVDNTASYSRMNAAAYFRFYYDNDFFTATDDYYTQGITLEMVHPKLLKNPMTRLLFQPKNTVRIYGLRADHYGYTPTSIRSEDILYGDRPFCSNLSVAAFSIAVDTLRQRRISSALSIGVMGPAAGSEGMQKAIHRWLNNIPPLGWMHQIKNDLILNYRIDFEQNIWRNGCCLLLNAGARVNFGTHTNKVSAGFTFILGQMNNPFHSSVKTKRWNAYLYARAQTGFTLYDATLQGGLFNRNSPYVIPASELTRFTFQGDFGFVVQLRKLYLEYSQSVLTKEFKTGMVHRWGGIRIGTAF